MNPKSNPKLSPKLNPKLERALGYVLRGVGANEKYLAFNDPRFAAAPVSIDLTSSVFVDGGAIPKRYAGPGAGENISPPLGWSGLPVATRELALILQDPDAPLPRPVTHVVVTGIPIGWTGLAEGALGPQTGPPLAFARGMFGKAGYFGPRPVLGHGPHRYVFQIFALGRKLTLPPQPKRDLVLAAMAETILARGVLVGTYERA
jgi:Raf kinase inhibitor-like YbhB/YbcL family protein